jgi:hypothetical protein
LVLEFELRSSYLLGRHSWCTDDTRRNFRNSGFLILLWEWKHRQTPTAEVGKILFVEKRRERLNSGECRGNQKLVVLWVRVGIGFYSFFFCVLPEGGDAFQMQTGISWGGEVSLGPPPVCPSL